MTEKGFYKFFLPECMAKVREKFSAYNSVKELPFTAGNILFIKDKKKSDY